MEDDGRGEASREAKVAPSTLGILSRILIWEAWYRRFKGKVLQWSDNKALSDYLTETEKDEFLKVAACDLAYFCRKYDPSGLSNNMLSDALIFFKLHNTWQAYICPIPECHCLFPDDDSLVLHLINEHNISCPFLQQNPTKERTCAKALHSTVWKPIDANSAVSLIYHDDDFDSLDWPLSEDFRRIKLLAELQREFEELLGSLEKKSFTLLSNGCLRALFAVASEDILRHLDLMNIASPSFRTLMYRSPLSFRFMEEESLCCFLKLVEEIRNLVEDQAYQNRESEGSQDSELIDLVSFVVGSEYFVLDGAKLNSCEIDEKRMDSWLFEAPYFPTISKFPAEASDILQLVRRKAVSFSECLTTVCGQPDLKLAALTSCLKMWNMGHWLTSIHDKSSHKLASNSESIVAYVDDMLSPSCFSVREPAKQSNTKYDYQHYLELIKFTCELQFFELQVRQLCAIDLRGHILPLLKSYLRMKLYLFFIVQPGSVTGDNVEEDDLDVGDVMEGSQDEQLYIALPELVSSGNSAIGITDLGPMMIDSQEALGGDPPGACADDTGSRLSQVECADAAPCRIRISTGAAIIESEAKHEAMIESDAEPETQCSQEFTGSLPGSLSYDFDMYSDSDSLSELEEEFEDRRSREFSDAARHTKGSGLFVRMTINDVVNYCLELEPTSLHDDAMNIWGLKANRTLKYWRCFVCEKRFPDQKSHMLHLESYHDLGISWNHDWFLPSHLQQDGSGVNEGVKEWTCRLDNSITVDCTYRIFTVEMERIQSSYQNEDMGKAQDVSQFGIIVGHINKQICYLMDLFDSKSRQCLPSEIIKLDAEVVQNFARLKKLKQELSNLCISNYKNEVLPYIGPFLKKQNLLDCGSWAPRRLKVLLGSVESSWHPDMLSIELESPGKVYINIEEHDARIGFSYVGIFLKFAGDLSGKGSRNTKGTFMFSATSDLYGHMKLDRKIILDIDHKMTRKLVAFKSDVASRLTWSLVDKLKEFQAEVLLGFVASSWHPDTVSIKLESPGKVHINIKEDDAGIWSSYVGIFLKFTCEVICQVKGRGMPRAPLCFQ